MSVYLSVCLAKQFQNRRTTCGETFGGCELSVGRDALLPLAQANSIF
jgi:hypothetical protein